MTDNPTSRTELTQEGVALLAAAAGMPIDPERLPDVTTVLAELFALETVLDELNLSGCGPDLGAASWPEERK